MLVCPSFLAGTPGTVPFSVSLNGVDFIADATAQMQYKFYEQPDYHIGLDPTGGPRQVRVRVRVRVWVRVRVRVWPSSTSSVPNLVCFAVTLSTEAPPARMTKRRNHCCPPG